VAAAVKIKRPVERDMYTRLFVSHGGIVHYGISAESMATTIDRLQYKEDLAQQEQEFKKLLEEVQGLQGRGEVAKALDLISKRSTEIKARARAAEFGSLLVPVNETDFACRQRNKPGSLDTGYAIGGEDLLLPSGAISILAAPTSHGKTTFTINLALNAVERYPNKEFYLFSYEEDADSVLLSALNTYIGQDLSFNNRKSLKSFYGRGESYFTAGYDGVFHSKRQRFFEELINTRRLNIHYSEYDSDTLIEAITYLHKTTDLGGVFIDYMQLLRKGNGAKFPSRQEELKQICLDLKDLAVKTGLPIVLGAQFNREVVHQLRLHPTKIGEAGDIERVANLIVGFWNNNFKPTGANEAELREIHAKGCDGRDTIYATILKQRGGKVGAEELLSFNGNSGKIRNFSSVPVEVYTM